MDETTRPMPFEVDNWMDASATNNALSTISKQLDYLITLLEKQPVEVTHE